MTWVKTHYKFLMEWKAKYDGSKIVGQEASHSSSEKKKDTKTNIDQYSADEWPAGSRLGWPADK